MKNRVIIFSLALLQIILVLVGSLFIILTCPLWVIIYIFTGVNASLYPETIIEWAIDIEDSLPK